MGARILVVDDDEDSRWLTSFVLEAVGHEVLLAANGSEGVEAARRDRPDLILMDVRMPVMDGFEARRLIRRDSSLRDIPIIALTATLMGDRGRERVRGAGFDGHIEKPIRASALVEQIDRYLSLEKRSDASPEKER